MYGTPFDASPVDMLTAPKDYDRSEACDHRSNMVQLTIDDIFTVMMGLRALGDGTTPSLSRNDYTHLDHVISKVHEIACGATFTVVPF